MGPSNRTITIFAFAVIAIIALGFVQLNYQNQLKDIIERQNEAAERLQAGQERANVRGNVTSDLQLRAINETRDLQANITRQEDIRSAQFVRYLEAESEDTDEELDDLRNITLAISDYLNITIPNETRDDHIMFEDGVISFDNGTKVGLGSTID